MATITGTVGRDVLSGTAAADQIFALGGNDVIQGSSGPDLLDGGEGSDTVDYSRLVGSVQLDLGAGWVGKDAGLDTLVSIGNALGTNSGDSLWGNGNANDLRAGAGDDFMSGGAGNDVLDGGPGSDTVFYGGSTAGVRVDLAAGSADDGYGTIDRIISVGLATGSSHDDTVSGNSNLNVLSGGDGNDRLFGREGDDTLLGGAGNDLLDGGPGSDTVSYLNESGPVRVNLATGEATDGGGGRDVIVSVGLVIGTPFEADTLIGNDNANTINGIGGANTLTGNGGVDTFVMNSWDWWGSTITDFQPGTDRLTVDLHSTPVTGYSAGPLDAARFATGTPQSEDWTFVYSRASGVVSFDSDGSGPDAGLPMVTLGNHPNMGAGDFLLT